MLVVIGISRPILLEKQYLILLLHSSIQKRVLVDVDGKVVDELRLISFFD